MKLVEYSNISEQTISQLNSFVKQCKQYDGMPPKIYWNILKANPNRMGDFYLFNRNQLVAYLGYFLFSPNEAEISALVHPRHRKQGLFMHLFDIARKRLTTCSIHQYAFACPTNIQDTKKCLQKLGAKYCSLEYSMTRCSYLTQKYDTNLQLGQATKNHIDLLASIDEICFYTNFKTMRKRFKQMLVEPNRLTWLAISNDQYVGKIHARIDENSVYLHDLCIIPEKRKRGYGTEMVTQAITKLHKLGFHTITLDVEASNKHALLIYKNCGFKVVNAYEYWRI